MRMESWRLTREEEKTVYSEIYEQQEKELSEDIQLKDFKALREKYKDAKHRPIYHFLRPDGYLNDPNGFCFWKGRWHLFYQALDKGTTHWGHAVSEDLVHWRDLPYAIYPQIETRCYSGGTCVDEENQRVIAAYYGTTGFDPESGYGCGIVIATSSDPLLLNWTKVKGGQPVIPDKNAAYWYWPEVSPERKEKPYKVYDPYIWKENGVYYLLSAGYENHPFTGQRFREEYLFRCTDDNLEEWEYIKPFLNYDCFKEPGDDGACPYFVPIGEDKRLLLHYSHRMVSKYLVGDYDPEKLEFRPFNAGRMTSGYGFFIAPSAFPCSDKSVAVIFNTKDILNNPNWHGCMTLPRRLTLGGPSKDELFQEPIADYSVLHENHVCLRNVICEEGTRKILKELAGDAFEMELFVKSEHIPSLLEIEVLRSPDGEETTRISFMKRLGSRYFDVPVHKGYNHVAMIDATHSSSHPSGVITVPEIAQVFATEQEEDLHMRIFVDKSILEVFVNNKQCLCSRVYPIHEDSVGISLYVKGMDGMVDQIDFWNMKSIY